MVFVSQLAHSGQERGTRAGRSRKLRNWRFFGRVVGGFLSERRLRNRSGLFLEEGIAAET